MQNQPTSVLVPGMQGRSSGCCRTNQPGWQIQLGQQQHAGGARGQPTRCPSSSSSWQQQLAAAPPQRNTAAAGSSTAKEAQQQQQPAPAHSLSCSSSNRVRRKPTPSLPWDKSANRWGRGTAGKGGELGPKKPYPPTSMPYSRSGSSRSSQMACSSFGRRALGCCPLPPAAAAHDPATPPPLAHHKTGENRRVTTPTCPAMPASGKISTTNWPTGLPSTLTSKKA